METLVRTPQLVFMQPQRLIVPLFQRPYVWGEETQWEPLWNDLIRVAERVLARPGDKHPPHFLGAVVLQQVQNPVGRMQERTIIDGQQRLTTLQLLLDALHSQLLAIGATSSAQRIQPLVENVEAFCTQPEDRFKVWPTNRDRPAFNAVMSATPPLDYSTLPFRGERLQEAHRYFSEAAAEWLQKQGPEAAPQRAAVIETAARDLLQLVVIDLTVDENAQEIFETLNARGAQLTAADLIKNFIFQRLMEEGADVESLYEKYWKEFETAFWEAEISVGRVRTPRSSLFLNHWLVARTGEEVVAREVFDRFKRYALHDSGLPMTALIQHLSKASKVYRSFIEAAGVRTGHIERLGLFGYRTGVLESEVIKPLVLCLLDPQEPDIPEAQIAKALDVVESWMVRRMLVRAATKSYSQVVAEMIALIRRVGRTSAGDEIDKFLAGQTGTNRYWPDDAELTGELVALQAYRRIGRGRLRMVLEAVEDHLRGWRPGQSAFGGERVARSTLAIEHVMPRKWQSHWPLLASEHTEEERDKLIHTLGNLTLLTGKLNSRVSNGPWLGEGGKRAGLEAHDVLLLNREVRRRGEQSWSEAQIEERTRDIVAAIRGIWTVPPGHKSGFATEKAPARRKRPKIADLIAAGVLPPGKVLIPRRKPFAARTATILPDGRIELEGEIYESPTAAAEHLVGHRMNGWWFFLVEVSPRKSLAAVRREYLDSLDEDGDEDDDDEDADDED